MTQSANKTVVNGKDWLSLFSSIQVIKQLYRVKCGKYLEKIYRHSTTAHNNFQKSIIL